MVCLGINIQVKHEVKKEVGPDKSSKPGSEGSKSLLKLQCPQDRRFVGLRLLRIHQIRPTLQTHALRSHISIYKSTWALRDHIRHTWFSRPSETPQTFLPSATGLASTHQVGWGNGSGRETPKICVSSCTLLWPGPWSLHPGSNVRFGLQRETASCRDSSFERPLQRLPMHVTLMFQGSSHALLNKT